MYFLLNRTYLPTRWTRAIYYFEIVNSKRSNGNFVAFAFRVVQYQYAVFNEMYFIRKLYGNIEFVRFMRVFFANKIWVEIASHNTEFLVATVRRRTARYIGISIMYDSYMTRRMKTMDAQTIYCTVCCGMDSRYYIR